MKKWLVLFLLLVPISMLLNVHQSKMYLQTKSAIGTLQHKQNQLLEENQKIIAEIARGSSPTAIEQLLRAKQGQNLSESLEKIDPAQVLRIVIPEEDDSP